MLSEITYRGILYEKVTTSSNRSSCTEVSTRVWVPVSSNSDKYNAKTVIKESLLESVATIQPYLPSELLNTLHVAKKSKSWTPALADDQCIYKF